MDAATMDAAAEIRAVLIVIIVLYVSFRRNFNSGSSDEEQPRRPDSCERTSQERQDIGA